MCGSMADIQSPTAEIRRGKERKKELECGPMPNVMAALLNIGGVLCSTPQSLAKAHYKVPCSNAAKTRKPLKFAGCPKLVNHSQLLVGQSSPYYQDMWKRGGIAV